MNASALPSLQYDLPPLLLRRLRVQNYRLWKDATLEFARDVPTVLIGPNGSGKSAWIDLFHLIRELAMGEMTHTVIDQKRRGIGAISNASSKDKRFEFTLTFERSYPTTRDLASGEQGSCLAHEEATYTAAFAIPKDGSSTAVVREEYSIQTNVRFLESHPKGTPIAPATPREKHLALVSDEVSFKAYNELERRGEEEKFMSPRNELAFHHPTFRKKDAYPRLVELKECLQRIFVYPGFATTPLWVYADEKKGSRRSQGVREMPRLDRRGELLVMALYHVYSMQPQAWERLTYHFCAEFPSVQRLYFPLRGTEMALAYKEQRTERDLELDDMSEGMIAYLSLLCALLVEDQATCLAFDEPDSHLHPSAIRRLMQVMEHRAETTPILLTTHSDRLLDFLSQPAQSVVICEPNKDGARLIQPNTDVLSAWLENYSLSELRTRGFLDPQNHDLKEKLETA